MAIASNETTVPTRFSLGIGRKRKWSRYSSRTFYLFASPWILGFFALTIAPLIFALLVSFTNYDGIDRWRWIGLKNYQAILHDPDAFYSLGRTLLYSGITIPLGIIGGLALAVILNQQLRGIGFFRTIFYLPAIVPVVAAATIWQSIYASQGGILNAILHDLGGHSVQWLLDPNAFGSLIVMVLWGLGGNMIISLAGLQGVPNELKEAAAIDGANQWEVFRNVSLPLLTPVLFFQVILSVIYSLQTLIQPLLLVPTHNASSGVSTVPHGNYLYMVHVYEQFFYFQRFGYGSALLWVLFAIILIFTVFMFRLSPYWVYYEVERQETKGA